MSKMATSVVEHFSVQGLSTFQEIFEIQHFFEGEVLSSAIQLQDSFIQWKRSILLIAGGVSSSGIHSLWNTGDRY